MYCRQRARTIAPTMISTTPPSMASTCAEGANSMKNNAFVGNTGQGLASVSPVSLVSDEVASYVCHNAKSSASFSANSVRTARSHSSRLVSAVPAEVFDVKTSVIGARFTASVRRSHTVVSSVCLVTATRGRLHPTVLRLQQRLSCHCEIRRRRITQRSRACNFGGSSAYPPVYVARARL